MDALVQDLRFALRSLSKQPVFTAIAVLTMALGIGVNSAIFTVVNAVVLQPLPFRDADRLVRVRSDAPGLGATDIGMSAPELFDLRDRSGIFAEIAGIYPIDANLTEVDSPERVEVLLVSPSYFSVLGAHPQLGRVFGPEDNHPGIAEVVVLSDAVWKRRFGGAPDAIGRKLRIDDDWYTVVGVMPESFRHPGRSLRTDVEMWAPSGYSAAPFGPPARGAKFLSGVIGRLKPGISVSEGQQRLDAFAQRMRAEYPSDYPTRAGWTAQVIPLQQDVVGNVKPTLLLLLGAVGIVLLIACANVAGLLLARAAARQRELAVRRALGSGRGRLARLLLTESVLLSLGGGLLGLLLAVWGVDLLVSLVPAGLPRLSEIAINTRVVLFTLGCAVGTGLLFGLAPALQFSNPDLLAAVKDARSVAGQSRRGVRAALVICEFALATVLLVGATLLLRSFVRLHQVDPGFDGRGVLAAHMWLPQPNDPKTGRYFTHEARLTLFEGILARLRELPGVTSSAIVQRLPLESFRGAATVTIDGRIGDATEQLPTVQTNIVSAEYFETMRIPVLKGSVFTRAHDVRGAPVVVINEEVARRYLGGMDPIGARIRFGGPNSKNPWMTILGVVGNVAGESLDAERRPMMYRPLTQASTLSMGVVVRAAGRPEQLIDAVGRAVRDTDPDLPVYAVQTMEQVQAATAASRRFSMQVLGGFALLALLLSAIGIYGVMAYLVSQRTHEIGIRMALGARPGSVVGMVLSYAMTLAAIGVLAGVVAAVVLTRFIAGMLFGISATDPSTFGVIALTLGLTAAVAAVTPARRAARVDPMVALRGD